MPSKAFWLLAVLTCGITVVSQDTQASSVDPVQEFRFAESEYQKSLVDGTKNDQPWRIAAAHFQSFVRRHANHELASLAHFYLAESLVRLSEYAAAREHYQRYLRMVKPSDGFVANAHYRIGETLYFEGHFEQSLAALTTFRTVNPDHAWSGSALWYSSQAAFQIAFRDRTMHNMSRARSLLGAVINLQNKKWNERALFQQGQLDYLARKFSSALKTFRLAQVRFDHGSDRLMAMYWIGKTHFSMTQYDDARQAFDQFQSLPPKHPLAESAHFYLAESCRLLKQSKAAKDHFVKYRLNWPEGQFADESLIALIGLELESRKLDRASELWNEFRQQFPHDDRLATTTRSLAQAYLQAKQPARAVHVFQSVATEDSAADPKDLYFHALALQGAGELPQAMERLQVLHERHRQSSLWADATYRLARYYLELDDSDQAKSLLRVILASDSNADAELICQSRYLLGTLAVASGRWDEVVDNMSSLVDGKHRLSETAQYWLAEAYYRLGDLDQAERQFEQLESKTRLLDALWVGMVPLRQSQILARRDRWSEAKAIASTIAARFPSFQQQHEVDLLLGRCHAANGQFTEAREAYRRATDSPQETKSETAAIAQWMIGESYFHQKRFEEALEAYLKAESQYPFERWRAASLVQAGKCYEIRGEQDSAIKVYSRVLRDFSDTPFHAEASQRLDIVRARLAKS